MNHDRAEVITAFAWLSLGALFSVLMETIYLGARVPVGAGSSIPLPITIVVALGFNMVLTKTARLWSSSLWLVFFPLGAWLLGYFTLLNFVDLAGVQALDTKGLNPWAAALLVSGLIGGVWPLFGKK